MRSSFDPNSLPPNMMHRLKKRNDWLDLVNYYSPIGGAANPSQPIQRPTIETLYIDGLTWYQACHRGAITTAMTFLLGGINPNSLDIEGSGFSGLHYAVSQDDPSMASILLEAGADVNLKAQNGGMTPLMVALDVAAMDTISLLLDKGANLNDVDATGEPALFYASNQPTVLHWLKTHHADKILGGGGELRKVINDKEETLLHRAAGKRNAKERWDVLYLCEQGNIDPNAVDSNGETPLYTAIRAQEYQHVAGLIQAGANVRTVVNKAGETPLQLPCKNAKIKNLLTTVNNAQNNATIEKLVTEDNSNFNLLFNRDSLFHVAVPFFVPNTLLVIGAYLPTLIGILILGATGYGFTQVAGFALKKHDRTLPTAGWFLGALCYGSGVLIKHVFPVFARNNTWGAFLIPLWYVATFLMIMCYCIAVLRDPGVVLSSKDQRQEIYDLIAKKGRVAIEIENIDMTSMVKKPFRSKHCTKTHRTVARFDHYCVWTGNAIGGGNHRPFVFYCFFEIISQLVVLYTTMTVVFEYAPTEAGVISFSSPAVFFDWLFSDDIAIVTYFLVIYNTALLLFVSMVMMQQFWFASRNVTSNEVWNATRYKWMFMLGTRAYSFYDKGFFKNLGEFFCTGNLVEVAYTLPKMNDHLRQLSRRHAQKMKAEAGIKDTSAVDNNNNTDAPPSEIVSSSSPSHQHGGKSFPALANDTAPTFGKSLASPTSSVSTSGSPTTDGQQQQPTPSAALGNAMAQAPSAVRNQMQLLQSMLGQMIREGKSEPEFPQGVDLSIEERSRMLQQVKTMYAQFQKLQGANAAKPSAAAS